MKVFLFINIINYKCTYFVCKMKKKNDLIYKNYYGKFTFGKGKFRIQFLANPKLRNKLKIQNKKKKDKH